MRIASLRLRPIAFMCLNRSAAAQQTGQLILDNVPVNILRELQILADLNGTSVSREAARIVENYLDEASGNQSHS